MAANTITTQIIRYKRDRPPSKKLHPTLSRYRQIQCEMRKRNKMLMPRGISRRLSYLNSRTITKHIYSNFSLQLLGGAGAGRFARAKGNVPVLCAIGEGR